MYIRINNCSFVNQPVHDRLRPTRSEMQNIESNAYKIPASANASGNLSLNCSRQAQTLDTLCISGRCNYENGKKFIRNNISYSVSELIDKSMLNTNARFHLHGLIDNVDVFSTTPLHPSPSLSLLNHLSPPISFFLCAYPRLLVSLEMNFSKFSKVSHCRNPPIDFAKPSRATVYHVIFSPHYKGNFLALCSQMTASQRERHTHTHTQRQIVRELDFFYWTSICNLEIIGSQGLKLLHSLMLALLTLSNYHQGQIAYAIFSTCCQQLQISLG